MRIEMINGIRVQYPDSGKWLYDGAPDYNRIFKNDYVILGKDVEPWLECINEEKEEFEKTHPAPEQEPETVEPIEQPTK